MSVRVDYFRHNYILILVLYCIGLLLSTVIPLYIKYRIVYILIGFKKLLQKKILHI